MSTMSTMNSLFIQNWKQHIIKTTTITQYDYYKKNNSSDEILNLVLLNSKIFGTRAEEILKKIFDIGPRSSSQNDGTKFDKKIEIKTSRYWGGTINSKWQHIEEEHDYEYVLVALLDFDKWKCWITKKQFLFGELKEKGLLKKQGNEGWMFNSKDITANYFTEIFNVEDFDKYLTESSVA